MWTVAGYEVYCVFFYPTNATPVCVLSGISSAVILSFCVSFFVSGDRYKISFIHIDKRDDQPNSITVNTAKANNQMNRTTTYVGPISLIHTHAFSTNT